MSVWGGSDNHLFHASLAIDIRRHFMSILSFLVTFLLSFLYSRDFAQTQSIRQYREEREKARERRERERPWQEKGTCVTRAQCGALWAAVCVSTLRMFLLRSLGSEKVFYFFPVGAYTEGERKDVRERKTDHVVEKDPSFAQSPSQKIGLKFGSSFSRQLQSQMWLLGLLTFCPQDNCEIAGLNWGRERREKKARKMARASGLMLKNGLSSGPASA